MPTSMVPVLRAVDEYSHVSPATYAFMRAEITRLQAEVVQLEQERAQLRRDLAVQEQQTNHWYLKATYTPAELQTMYTRRSKDKNEFTGAWLTTDEQAAYDAMEQLAALDQNADAAPSVQFEQGQHRAA